MSPKTKEQNAQIRQKSMETIKEVALELFAHNGYHSTSISQIAKEAGVSKGLLYNYFSSKEELLQTIVLETIAVGERLMELLQVPEDPFLQLKHLTDASLQTIKSNLHYWKLFTSLAFQTDVFTSLEPILKQKQEVALKQLVEVFERLEVPNPKQEAYLYSATLDGIFLHYIQLEDSYPIDEMIGFLLEKYLRK